MIWVPLVFSGVACLFDLKRREIPDFLVALTLLSGLFFSAVDWSAVAWSSALLGFVLAFALVIPVALMDGLGGGDLKFLTALGTWLGPWGVISVLFWMALAGMGCALVAKFMEKKDFPYAPAIAAGLLIYAAIPDGVSQLAQHIAGLVSVN